jgi:SNF2 family DNA or RNA helicase
MEDSLQCPLVTAYATTAGLGPADRPFEALSVELLEKLYTIRKWDLEAWGPIKFSWPSLLRKTIWDITTDTDSGEPLTLKEFQKQAIIHLTRMPRFILGDSVGLGKTLDAIASFCWLKERFPELKLVVVTTKSTTYQWADEIRRYSLLRPYVMRDTFRGLKGSEARYMQMISLLEGQKKDVMIVKYSSLIGTRKTDEEGQTERLSEEIRTFTKILKEHSENTIVVFDECHKFKSTGTSTRKLVQEFSKNIRAVWAMTATAIKNGLDEFYSIADAIGIKPLGNIYEFRNDFCLYRKQYIGRGRYKKILTGYQNVPTVKAALRPFFLGRSQRQVKEKLPRLSTVFHPIDLNDKQVQILEHDLPSGNIELPPILYKVAGEAGWREKERDPENKWTQLSVQQLVTNHWALLDRNNEKEFHTRSLSPKEEALLDMLDGDYRGEKVVVYTKYRTWIDRLEWLTKNNYFTSRKFLRITGAENEKKRNDNKTLFQAPDSGHDLIVINAAGMDGINLQQAAHMIMLDVPWSWGDLIQLVGRMVRMASPHSACTLHVMVAKGTIDEYAIDTLKSKKGVFEKILGESHSAGILDDGGLLDLESGMEAGGTEEEFADMLHAHVKKGSMKDFLSGDNIGRAKNANYQMSFEKGKKQQKKKQELVLFDAEEL